MQEHIELVADIILMMLLLSVALLLSHVDPMLPFLWLGATTVTTCLTDQ